MIEEKDLRGRWHRIEFHVRWATDKTGFVKVWANGSQKVDYRGATMDASRICFKYGIYRSSLSRYKNMYHAEQVPARKVYYAKVQGVLSRAELQ